MMQKVKQFIKTPLFITFLIFLGIALITAVLFQFLENGNTSIFSFFDAIWWSVVTMSTTGYGDIIPATQVGRVIAIVTMLLGIVASSLLTGTITTVYFKNINRHQRGHMQYLKLKGHLVICGWRNNMKQLLLQVISNEKNNMKPEKILIIANPPQNEVDALLRHHKLSQVKFIRGDYYDKDVLRKANIAQAQKAFILTESGALQNDTTKKEKSSFEVDSRTVMSVLSIKSLNQNIYVSAQLLERNFELYLQKAKCDEILFPKEINESILSKTVLNNGMSNIIQTLIGSAIEPSNTSYNIGIKPIKDDYIGKTYTALQPSYQEKNKMMLIGILENTSTYHNVYQTAICEAQKTSNFAKMVENMKKMRALKPYNPILVPQADYIIQKYSAAIVLERN